MTRDHRRKKAVRAHASATGRTYLDAATSLTDSPTGAPVLAGRLRDGLVEALQSAGWPVQVEHNPQGTALRSYAGPAIVDVSRAVPTGHGDSGRMSGAAEESAGTDSARMWRTWLTADTTVPQGQAQQVPFCTG
jgi:hypothetical protein